MNGKLRLCIAFSFLLISCTSNKTEIIAPQPEKFTEFNPRITTAYYDKNSDTLFAQIDLTNYKILNYKSKLLLTAFVNQ